MAQNRSRGRTNARRLLNSVLSSPWFVKRDWLQEFAGLAEEARARGDDLSAGEFREKLREALASLATEGKGAESLALSYGEPMGPDLRATIRDGVAIIPIHGPLYHYASEFDDVCGCSSYEQIARDFRAALASADVQAILFDVDSPGGEVAGCSELAQMIFDARAEKPSVAYVSDLGTSAAYYLASASGSIRIAKAAILGSIGVAMTYVDTTERDAKAGIRRIEIISSQSPKKRPDPTTDEGRAQIQDVADDLAAVFIEDVARFRGVSEEKVLTDFGRGGVLVGAKAVTAGLADGLGSFEGVLAELCARITAPAAGDGHSFTPLQEPNMAQEDTGAATSSAAPPATPTVTAETVASDHPAVAEQLRAEGATRERTRILGIEDLSIAGHETLIRQAKEDGGCTVEMAAVRLVQAQRANPAPPAPAGADGAKKHLANLAGTEAELDAPRPSAATPAPDSNEAQVAQIMGAGKVPAVVR